MFVSQFSYWTVLTVLRSGWERKKETAKTFPEAGRRVLLLAHCRGSPSWGEPHGETGSLLPGACPQILCHSPAPRAVLRSALQNPVLPPWRLPTSQAIHHP